MSFATLRDLLARDELEEALEASDHPDRDGQRFSAKSARPRDRQPDDGRR
jgi:hypothetical protein